MQLRATNMKNMERKNVQNAQYAIMLSICRICIPHFADGGLGRPGPGPAAVTPSPTREMVAAPRRYDITYDIIKKKWYHLEIMMSYMISLWCDIRYPKYVKVWYNIWYHHVLQYHNIIIYDIIKLLHIIYDIIYDIIFDIAHILWNCIWYHSPSLSCDFQKLWYHIWYHRFWYDILYGIIKQYDINRGLAFLARDS